MDGFNPMVKMKCGGGVSKAVEKAKMCSGGKMKEGGDVDKKQDKSLIKKAFKQHDEQEHPGEKTELKLKQGGRSKKAAGTVKKYKAGGAIEMKKDAGDIDDIKKIKATKAKKTTAKKADGGFIDKVKGMFGGAKPAATKPAAAKSAAGVPTSVKTAPPAQQNREVRYQPSPENAKFNDDYKKGGNVKKMADGRSTGIPPELLEQMMRAKAAGQGMSRPQQGGMVPPQGGMPQPQGGMPNPNAYQRFQQANPNAKPGMTPEQIQQILMSPQFQQSNRNFTDR